MTVLRQEAKSEFKLTNSSNINVDLLVLCEEEDSEEQELFCDGFGSTFIDE